MTFFPCLAHYFLWSSMEPLLPPISALQVETFYFSPAVKAPGTDKTLFLGGAGARGLEIQGKFIKFTAIGVYLAPESIPFLAERWKGKAAEELAGCVEFFRDVITGPFEKFTRVTMILPLTGLQYSEKVAENCVAIWKSMGIYTNAEAMALDKFKQIFKDENFPPGASILFTQSPSGSLTISFSKDSSIPAVSNGGIIENKAMSEAVLASIIGPNGVSPEAKLSLAGRMADLLSEYKVELHLPPVSALHVEAFNFPPAMKAPGTEKTMFLGGAGARGLEIQGKFVKFTAIGVYLAPEALPFLARRWKGKAAEELAGSVEFFRDVITGPFEKFTRVTMILPLTGLQYSEKVAENCVAIWKSVGIYTNAEAMAVDKFKQIFKDENFPPGASILFTQSSSGSLTISFSKDSSIPAVSNGGIIENKAMSEAVLSSIIGPNGVSPELKVSLAGRVADLLSEYKG